MGGGTETDATNERRRNYDAVGMDTYLCCDVYCPIGFQILCPYLQARGGRQW